MNKLYMMIGLPASGKSTIAEEISKSEGAIIVSSDEIRKELLGDINDQTKNELIFETVEDRIKFYLANKQDVIFDATNINYKKRKAFLQRMKNSKCFKAIAILVATPYEECLIRNAKRERKVPEEVIKRMYYSFYIPQYYEGFDEIEIISNALEWDEKVQKQYTMVKLLESINIPQDNPWHTLTVRQHCEKVQELLDKDILNHKYYMRDIGIFHDIGKVQTKSFVNSKGETTDIAHYYNHEKVSAYISVLPILWTKYIPKEDLIKRKKKCRNCKSELTYTDNDVKIACDIEGFAFGYFDCPVCGEELYPSLLDKKVKK